MTFNTKSSAPYLFGREVDGKTLEFQFQSDQQGEIHGIVLDEDDELSNTPRIFQLFGTQAWNGAIDMGQQMPLSS